MNYILNGGGQEFRSLASPEVTGWLQDQGINTMLVVAFAMVEEYWQRVWEKPPAQFGLPGITMLSLSTTNYSEQLALTYLSQADAVWFPGGSPETLLSRVRSTGFLELLLAAQISQKIKVIGGASAGEMALGQRTMVGHQDVNRVIDAMAIIPGYLFDSHFSDRGRLSRLRLIIDKEPELTGVGIDEDTTLVLDAKYQPQSVFGPGTVTYYKAQKEPVIYSAKTRFPG